MSNELIPLPPSLAAATPPQIRITNVSVTRLSFRPPRGSFVHECGPVVLTKYDVAVVEIHTDAGITGIGPGNPHDESDLSQFVSRNPFDLLSQHAPAGVNVACWDIVGKALGQPVFRLLSGDRPASICASRSTPAAVCYGRSTISTTAAHSAPMPSSSKRCAAAPWASTRSNGGPAPIERKAV